MAILASNDYGYIICHETYINKIYSNTVCNKNNVAFRINPVLYDLFEQFRNNRNKKNKSEEFDTEVKLILRAYKSLFELYNTKEFNSGSKSIGNKEARDAANKFYNLEFQYPDNPFSGGNNADVSIITKINSQCYLFPKRCSFFSCDIKDLTNYLQGQIFHFILMDPPWWNKSIRRKRKHNTMSGYTMLYNESLMNIPVEHLLHKDGLVGIWCTSAPSHISAILTELFPAWNMEFISQWFWLKVTKHGLPICEFSSTLGKQPYERIIFGMHKNWTRKYKNPENGKVIMSVPSAIHSHKPPICELIEPYIQRNGNCLEIFARYLLPHWTSCGNEVLKLQHSSLYNEADR